ncbi:MAG: DUF108 domain-containing protein [Alphaproteobacteria bacterium]|nr:DUF108 domain-containing protein [Alphaproteobacteria bacterium]
MNKKIGIAGMGAIGSAVARALIKGIPGYELAAISDINPPKGIKVPVMDFAMLAEECDMIIESLPPYTVPALAREIFSKGKDLILISSSALLLYPEIEEHHKLSQSRIIVPSGALAGIDGVRALAQMGIKTSRIATTKAPKGYAGAPYIVEQKIDLSSIKEKTKLFSGNAREAAMAFPANINVAATLSLAGIGPDKTAVEIWADPKSKGNCHEIVVSGEFSTITARVENTPDPNNPKSSMLAAQSIVSILKGLVDPLVVL